MAIPRSYAVRSGPYGVRTGPYGTRGVRYGARRPTFIPRPPVGGGTGAGLGAGAGGLAAALGSIALPLLCLGCLASLALLGLFATMIGATSYMGAIQRKYRDILTGSGNMVDMNMLVLFSALLCSFYVLFKHHRGMAGKSN